MKRLGKITGILVAVFLVVGLAVPTRRAEAAPAVGAKAYVLMEASTGRVLLENNRDAKLPMASTTKIMTCLLAVENGNMDDIVTIPKEAVGQEGTSIYLREGEKVAFSDLVYGLMLASGNDAAVAIAIHLAGSVEAFAQMMNDKAREIGATNSNFVTPNGLPDDNHYTTAYDLALISSYAMQNEQFCEIVGTSKKDLAEDDDSPARYLRSKNKILYQYEGGNGIKTGYTKAAGKCLSAGAKRDNMQLVAVVLNDYDMFVDCMALLDYGFEHYAMRQVAEAGKSYGEIPVEESLEGSVQTALCDNIYLPLTQEEVTMVEEKVNMSSSLAAPVQEGEVVGVAEFSFGDMKVKSNIITISSARRKTYEFYLSQIMQRWLGLAEQAG